MNNPMEVTLRKSEILQGVAGSKDLQSQIRHRIDPDVPNVCFRLKVGNGIANKRAPKSLREYHSIAYFCHDNCGVEIWYSEFTRPRG